MQIFCKTISQTWQRTGHRSYIIGKSYFVFYGIPIFLFFLFFTDKVMNFSVFSPRIALQILLSIVWLWNGCHNLTHCGKSPESPLLASCILNYRNCLHSPCIYLYNGSDHGVMCLILVHFPLLFWSPVSYPHIGIGSMILSYFSKSNYLSPIFH